MIESKQRIKSNLARLFSSGRGPYFLREIPSRGVRPTFCESFFTLIQRLARKPSVNLLYPRHKELAGLNLRISGSSSAWCSAHKGSAAAGRMFEDPEFLRFGSARLPWSLEQQSSRPVYKSLTFK
ncbi:MAG: hypothetical protein IPK68_08030 [Bdellovibrionales bacterium]|nr:hypothetical protein [Bdellovibrionales bacterium]